MKKKLASALIVFASLTAFTATDAQARRYHHGGAHSARHSAHKHHKAAYARHRVRRHASRGSRAGRPAAWCGWWLGQHLGMADRNLWLARNWASRGSNAGGPGVGVVVVWRHHVGIITGRQGNQWVVKSGNDGHVVRERVRSVSGAIAFRRLA